MNLVDLTGNIELNLILMENIVRVQENVGLFHANIGKDVFFSFFCAHYQSFWKQDN